MEQKKIQKIRLIAVQKNTEYTLKEELPVILRLEIYREALRLLESNDPKDRYRYNDKYDTYNENESLGLCLLLPCILWNLKNYLVTSVEGHNECWDFEDVYIAFPEISHKQLNRCSMAHNKRAERIKVLKESIHILEKLLN